MCHSVEMYMPRMTERLAERRIGEEAFAAAERERRVLSGLQGLAARLKIRVERVLGGRKITQEQTADV